MVLPIGLLDKSSDLNASTCTASQMYAEVLYGDQAGTMYWELLPWTPKTSPNQQTLDEPGQCSGFILQQPGPIAVLFPLQACKLVVHCLR